MILTDVIIKFNNLTMSNPKLLTISSSRNKRFDESNLINFVDKLPRKLSNISDIMKEDKILLRKRIKEGDAILHSIFNKKNIQSVKDEDDFKRIETTVRKYLN